jgi:hypothetical protein
MNKNSLGMIANNKRITMTESLQRRSLKRE